MVGIKTVSGEKVVETPHYDLGYKPHHILDGYGSSFYGDPNTRYGKRTTSKNVTTKIKMQMMSDHRIALANYFIFAPLVGAPWEIQCADPGRQAFFEAMWTPIHRSFMLQAVLSIPVGFLAMIKKLRFKSPGATSEQRVQGIEPWTGTADPVTVVGFDQIHPAYADPLFDDNDRFIGIRLSHTSFMKPKDVPLDYSLWLTRGLAEAYGDYRGMGRLVYAYDPWWDSMFSRDLRIRHIERCVDPAIKVYHPPGGEPDPDDPNKIKTSYKTTALELGEQFRSGATVNIPSSTYLDENGRPTSIRQWDIEAVDGMSNMGAFEIIRSQDDADIFMGMLIPPQALEYAKESLGGTGVAQVLIDTATNMLINEWQNIADHIESYVFAPLSRWNFGDNDPPVHLVGRGFRDEDTAWLESFITAWASRPDSDVSWFDAKSTATQLGAPVVEDEFGEEALSLAQRSHASAKTIMQRQRRERDGLEEGLTRGLRSFFRGQAKRIIERGARVKAQGLRFASGEQLPFDLGQTFWEEETRKIDVVIGPHIDDIAVAGSEGGAHLLEAQTGIGVDWTVGNQSAIDWADRHALELATDLTNTTRGIAHQEMSTWLRQDITDWMKEGEALPGLIRRMQKRGLGKARAELIASTEVTTAYAQGNIAAWKQSPFVTGKRWRTVQDELVCPYCSGLDGKVVEIEGDFEVAPEGLTPLTVDAPAAHPGCRCYLQPFLEEIPKGAQAGGLGKEGHE